MPTATLSTKGQLVLPVEVRERAGLKAGDRMSVTYDQESGTILLRPALTLDEIAAKASAWIRPDTPPLENVSDFYETRPPRL